MPSSGNQLPPRPEHKTHVRARMYIHTHTYMRTHSSGDQQLPWSEHKTHTCAQAYSPPRPVHKTHTRTHSPLHVHLFMHPGLSTGYIHARTRTRSRTPPCTSTCSGTMPLWLACQRLPGVVPCSRPMRTYLLLEQVNGWDPRLVGSACTEAAPACAPTCCWSTFAGALLYVECTCIIGSAGSMGAAPAWVKCPCLHPPAPAARVWPRHALRAAPALHPPPHAAAPGWPAAAHSGTARSRAPHAAWQRMQCCLPAGQEPQAHTHTHRPLQ